MSHPIYLKPAINYIDKWLEQQKMIDPHVPGYSVAISYKGKIVFEKGYGVANIEKGEAMCPDHVFRVASHTKTFTAVALLQLEEKGVLSLNDPISDYLPFLKNNKDKRIHDITIHNALSHAAGIMRDGDGDSFWSLYCDFPSKKDVIDFFERAPLTINVNERLKYSNMGFALLGMVIEAVTGKQYSQVMIENILTPTGLNDISPAYSDETKNLITGYTLSPEGQLLPVSSHIDTKGVKAATSFCASASSLSKFYSMLCFGNENVISDTSKRKAFKQEWHIPEDPLKNGYGLGFFIMNDYQGRNLIGHGGGMPGNITMSLFDPKDGLSVCVFTNSHRGDPRALQKGIWQSIKFFKDHYKKHSDLFVYEGHYYNIWRDIYFTAIDDKLYGTSLSAKEPFTMPVELTYQDQARFKVTRDHGMGSYGEDVTFNKDETGYYEVVCAALYRMLKKEPYLEHLKMVGVKK